MRILLVEDDRQLRLSIARGLKEAGYGVDQTGNGLQALALAESGAYAAVVLDILLPGKRGDAVCRELRGRGNRVPILLLTALDGVDQRIAGLDAGADDYLPKPFDFGELLARLRALTRRGREPAAAQLVVGDLVIDTARRSVRRNRRPLDLTATEYEFLLHLARNAGRVVTRAELMAQVWEDSASNYSNILDVYASRLRRKLDEGEKLSLFSTLRGTGFMLDAPDSAVTPRGAARRRG